MLEQSIYIYNSSQSPSSVVIIIIIIIRSNTSSNRRSFWAAMDISYPTSLGLVSLLAGYRG